jgi:hypothetical protein
MIQFKTERIENEWNGEQITQKMVDLTNMVNLYSEIEFGKSIVITCIMRTAPEQYEIYKNNPKFQKKPWQSTHQFGRAIDIRSHIYSTDEIEKIVSFANMVTYDPKRPNKKTALAHTVGAGFHIHFQVMP